MRNLNQIILLVAMAAIASQAYGDTIKFVDGRRPQGDVTVLDETLEKVEYRLKNVRQAQSYPSSNILEVIYSSLPDSYTMGQENLEAMAFSDAADMFMVASQEAGRKKGLASNSILMASLSYLRGGMYKQAIEVSSDLAARFPESRYIPDSRMLKAMALLRSGNEAQARIVLTKLKEDAVAKGYGKRWVFEADLQLLIMDEAKNPSKALASYQDLASQTESSFPSVANQAKLRIGRVYIDTGKYGEAKNYFQNIIDTRSSSSRGVIAGAFNGLGSALREDPKSTGDDLRDALYSHLRVVVSYPDVIEEQAEALYGAGKCFQRVEVEDAETRSRRMLGQCIREYPNSPWATEAQKG